jgi:hypothetical protein
VVSRENGKICDGMKPRAIPLWWCSLALLIGGCPKRQAPPRIVYVPSPPPAAMQAQGPESPPAMVIEEPPPPEPVVVTPKPETQAPTDTDADTAPKHHRGTHKEQVPAAPETDEEPPPPVPSLEPRGSSTEQAAQRREIQGLQDDVQKRIARLSTSGLSGVDRKTLEDAKAFFTQSTQALNEADLQRALMLARKASLLVSALEK